MKKIESFFLILMLFVLPTLVLADNYYFNGGVDNDWNNVQNWWLDTNSVTSSPNVPVGASSNAYINTDIAANGGDPASVETLTFNGSSQLRISASAIGLVEFLDTSSVDNSGTITSSSRVNFRGSSVNEGTVYSPLTYFYSTSVNNNAVNSTSYFYGTSVNNATVDGDAYFDCNATNNGSVSGTTYDICAPVFSSVSPASDATIDSVTDASDISYTLSENVVSGTIIIERTGGTADPDSSRECALVGTALTSGEHTIDLSDTADGCSDGYGSDLVAGAVYTFQFSATDADGNAATSVARNNVTFADSVPPTISSVSSIKAPGTYTVGEVIDIYVEFSEAVTSTGNVTVTLETGATDRTCTFTVSNSAIGTCDYTVQAGDTLADLTVSSISGTIADQSSNEMTNFVPAINLATNEAIVIDSTIPFWTQRTSAGARVWGGIASSLNGVKLAASTNGSYIYTSTDSGVNWTQQTNSGSRSWQDITSSSDGTKLAATANNGYIYTSTDSGANWTEQTGSGSRLWRKIVSSSDGTILSASVVNSVVFTSTNSGVTWNQSQNLDAAGGVRHLAMSSDGSRIYATPGSGFIQVSTDYGLTWSSLTGSGSRIWTTLATSPDGTKIVSTVSGGIVYTSTDSGANWTAQSGSGSRAWSDIAISSDGLRIVATVTPSGQIYTSSDGGMTWVVNTGAGSGSWLTVTSSASGKKLAAGGGPSNYISTGAVYDITAPSAPGTPNMTSATDSGSSNSDNITSDTTPSFTISCEIASTVTLYRAGSTSLGSEICESGTVTITSSTLTEATHSITAKQVDEFSNESSASSALSVTIDSTTPTPSSVASTTAATTATVTWTTTGDSSDSKVSYGTSSGTYTTSTSSASLVTSHSLGLTSLSASTLYYYVAVSKDTAGNIATSSEQTLRTTSASDLTAPIISVVTAVTTPTTDTTPSYTFTTDEAGDITYGGSCSSGITSASVGSNTVTFNTLAVGTYSNCTITVTDSSDNVSNSLAVNDFTLEEEEEEVSSGGGGGSGGGGSSRRSTLTTPTTPAPTIESLTAELNRLQAILNSLLAGITSSTSLNPNYISPSNPTPSFYVFRRNLKTGDTGEDVRELQKFLNSYGYTIANFGPGSKGQETDLFGFATRYAVARYQEINGINPALGYFGPMTRKMVNGGVDY